MKKLLSSAVLILLFTAVSCNGINLLKNGDFSRYKVNWITPGTVKEEGKAGVLTLSGKNNRAFSRQVIDCTDADTFELSGEISADKAVQVLIGVIPVDKNWKEINFRNTGVVAGTFTKLAKATAKNSNTVILPENRKITKNTYLAFGAKEDNSDLPNFQLERIKSVSHANGSTVVKLVKPVKKHIPAGTAVRCHVDGPTFIYCVSLRKGLPGKVNVSGKVGKNAKLKFRSGSAGFKVCLLAVFGKNTQDAKVEFRNLKVVKSAK